MSKQHSLKAYAQEYATLWDSMEIVRDTKIIDNTAKTIIEFRSTYELVEAETNVPWYVVGIMDMREGGGRCRTHLHNGDSLKKPTVRVPAKRPAGSGPFTFHASACDALRMKGYDKIAEWTVEQMAFVFERYNGFGYRSKSINIPSPYLWGGTNHQAKGKYIRDHVFSREVMDTQVGCMPLLKVIAQKCSIDLVSELGATQDPQETSPASNRKADPKPIAAVIKDAISDNRKEIATAAVLVGGGTAANQTAETPAPKPKLTAKEVVAKGQEYKGVAEQAKDLGIAAQGFGKWAIGDGMMISAAIGLAVVAAWGIPKIKERFS